MTTRLEQLHALVAAASREIVEIERRNGLPVTTRSQADQVIAAFAEHYDIGRADILGRDRKRHVTRARHDTAYALHRAGWSLPAIGDVLGRDHTTILYAVRTVRADQARARRALSIARRYIVQEIG